MKFLTRYIIALLLCAVPCAASPDAPSGVSAAPQWAADCAKCHMAMPHIVVNWNPVAGAESYVVRRGSTILQSGVTANAVTDMDVQSGETYSYTVAAVGADGQESQASAVQTATAPAAGAVPPAPSNLCVSGFWDGGAGDDVSWTPVPGAAAYNVYQYNKLVGSRVSRPAFRVKPGVWALGLTYTVTTVDASGAESLPSAPATAQGANDPNATPAWRPDAPARPTVPRAAAEWNNGSPRVRLRWRGDGSDFTYCVFRDGRRVADGLWGLTYLDADVSPGETHTYTIRGVNVDGQTRQESVPSSLATVTLPSTSELSRAAASSLPAVTILRVVPNDDSAEIFFQPVLGAIDYRVYDTLHPGKFKYAGLRTRQTRMAHPLMGLSYSIEWNGIDPAKGSDLVVEAVDKLGPFQTMDGQMGPGAMTMDGMDNIAINGQGDPSNVPVALARSGVLHVTPQPRKLDGEQSFFDTFRNEQPLVQNLHPDARIVAQNPGTGNFGEWANDKWTMRCYQADLTATRLFFMGGHFMDTLYDGGTAGGNVIHNNNASVVMMPNATADISGGKVLHATFEVDAHFDGRRWCDVFVGEAGDPLLLAGKFMEDGKPPTVSGNLFRWEIRQESHMAQMFKDGTGTDVMGFKDWNEAQTVTRVFWDHVSPFANGTQQDLDKRHRFDLYLSKTHFRLLETTPDGRYSVVRDADLPAGQSLPFDKAQVYFVHQLYHTGNDRNELVTWYPYETYWHNLRPWCDERHWDNMGQEVLSAFPAMPSFKPLP